MKITEKAYAKINLALSVTGTSEGFHTLDSIVTTVDLFDTVTLSPRRDNKINVIPEGLKEYVYNHIPSRDNAYRAVSAFMQAYGVGGADVVINKRIPISSGMGGSSTDASAVLRAMKRAYKVQDADLFALANQLGSDTAYLLEGGYARIQGRGEIITPLEVKPKFNFIVLFCDEGVDTKECFSQFDKLGKFGESGAIERLIDSLKGEKVDYSLLKNDLLESAIQLNDGVKKNLEAIRALSPDAYFMTGSGSAVCAVFDYDPLCDWALDKLKKQGLNAIKVRSVFKKK